MLRAHFATGEIADPILGRLIATRRRIAFHVFLAGVSGFIGLPVSFGILYELVVSLTSSKGAPVFPLLIGLAIGAALLGFSWLCIREARTKYCFYELGATKVRGRVLFTIHYPEAMKFIFRTPIQRGHFGTYLWTVLYFQLYAPGRRSMSFAGKFRMRPSNEPRGFFSIPRMEPNNPMESVKDIIAGQMADAIIARLLAGELIGWGGLASLGANGIVPHKGRLKGVTIQYSRIRFVSRGEGNISLNLDDGGQIAELRTGSPNFWPMFAACERMSLLDSDPGF